MAVKLLEEMIEKNLRPTVVTYTSIIHGQWKNAIIIFFQMVKNGVRPNVVTFNAMIYPLFKRGQTCEAKKRVCVMVEIGEKPNVITYGSMMNGYILEGHLDEAVELFQSIAQEGIKPDKHAYGILISGYFKNGQIEEAMNMLDEMQKKGAAPDVVTTCGVLSDEFCKNHRSDGVTSIISRMHNHGISLDTSCQGDFIKRVANWKDDKNLVEFIKSIVTNSS